MPFSWIPETRLHETDGAPMPFRSAQGARVCWEGRELVNFAADDYLNLAADRRLARAAMRALRRYGCGAGAAPYVAGYLPPQRQLERALARFLGTEDAAVFSSGYDAALGVMTVLLGPDDIIFADCLNDAGLQDGGALCGAAVQFYDHCQSNQIHDLLQGSAPHARRRLIATDSLFGLDGDLAPLQDLAALAVRHDAMLLINEAHAVGIMGPRGRGLSEWLEHWEPGKGLELIRIGSLGKAIGAHGGFVAGPDRLINWLRRYARCYAQVTAATPPVCAAARHALRIIEREPDRRMRVLRLAAQLREALRSNDFAVGASQSHIVSVLIGSAEETRRIAARMRDRGFLASAVTAPLVPHGAARLRLAVSAGHHPEEIHALVHALSVCRSTITLTAAV